MEKPKEKGEILRWYRNLNIAAGVGFIALAAVVPAASAALYFGAAVNGAQAGGAEVIRQARIKKSKSQPK